MELPPLGRMGDVARMKKHRENSLFVQADVIVMIIRMEMMMMMMMVKMMMMMKMTLQEKSIDCRGVDENDRNASGSARIWSNSHEMQT